MPAAIVRMAARRSAVRLSFLSSGSSSTLITRSTCVRRSSVGPATAILGPAKAAIITAAALQTTHLRGRGIAPSLVSRVLQQRASLAKHIAQHRPRQLAGEGILLTRMVAGDQADAVIKR